MKYFQMFCACIVIATAFAGSVHAKDSELRIFFVQSVVHQVFLNNPSGAICLAIEYEALQGKISADATRTAEKRCNTYMIGKGFRYTDWSDDHQLVEDILRNTRSDYFTEQTTNLVNKYIALRHMQSI